jgi:hypothetical protein
MVIQQPVGDDGNSMFITVINKPSLIKGFIITKEHILTTVAPLGDRVRNIRENLSGSS